jgi:hypothetical protein
LGQIATYGSRFTVHAHFLREDLMPPRIARLAGLGAFAACGGIAALYALFLFITRPGPTSGMDGTSRAIAWMSVAGVLLALLGVHLVLGRQLLALARGEPRPV